MTVNPDALQPGAVFRKSLSADNPHRAAKLLISQGISWDGRDFELRFLQESESALMTWRAYDFESYDVEHEL